MQRATNTFIVIREHYNGDGQRSLGFELVYGRSRKVFVWDWFTHKRVKANPVLLTWGKSVLVVSEFKITLNSRGEAMKYLKIERADGLPLSPKIVRENVYLPIEQDFDAAAWIRSRAESREIEE